MATDNPDTLGTRLVKAWAFGQQKSGRGPELRVVDLESAGRKVAASITPEGYHGVLIPLHHGEVLRIPKDFRSSSRGALRAEVAQFSKDYQIVDALHVWCADSMCIDAFTSFSCFLIDRMGAESSLDNVLAESYAEFQKLLGASATADGSILIGLLGELLVLLDGSRKHSGMVRAWAGTRGERHDFRIGNSAIEVKCSLRSEMKANRIHVSDWDQLEEPAGGSLHLHSIRLERVAGGDWTVPKLITAIQNEIDLAERRRLDDCLSRFGKALEDCTWEFSVKTRSTYHVTDGFPRLIPRMLASGLAPGISSVSYTLDLDHAEAFKVDWEGVLEGFLQEQNNA